MKFRSKLVVFCFFMMLPSVAQAWTWREYFCATSILMNLIGECNDDEAPVIEVLPETPNPPTVDPGLETSAEVARAGQANLNAAKEMIEEGAGVGVLADGSGAAVGGGDYQPNQPESKVKMPSPVVPSSRGAGTLPKTVSSDPKLAVGSTKVESKGESEKTPNATDDGSSSFYSWGSGGGSRAKKSNGVNALAALSKGGINSGPGEMRFGSESTNEALDVADPEDYFSRIEIHSNIFQVVEVRYRKETVKWPLLDATKSL